MKTGLGEDELAPYAARRDGEGFIRPASPSKRIWGVKLYLPQPRIHPVPHPVSKQGEGDYHQRDYRAGR